jgi:hypothetical protein
MKRLHFYAMAMLLIGAIVGLQQAVSSQTPTAPAPGTINVRVFFGKQLGSINGPCSTIKIIAKPKNGNAIVQLASGPKLGAKGGQCTGSLKNVPVNVPITLTAEYADSLSSKPDDTYGPPAGKWTNPLTLKPGETVMKYLKIDGKP